MELPQVCRDDNKPMERFNVEVSRLAELAKEITTKLVSEIAVELNRIRVYLRRGLNVYIILMFRFMCYCIKNVCFYNNLSIAK